MVVLTLDASEMDAVIYNNKDHLYYTDEFDFQPGTFRTYTRLRETMLLMLSPAAKKPTGPIFGKKLPKIGPEPIFDVNNSVNT